MVRHNVIWLLSGSVSLGHVTLSSESKLSWGTRDRQLRPAGCNRDGAAATHMFRIRGCILLSCQRLTFRA